jgi:hypothetical protein
LTFLIRSCWTPSIASRMAFTEDLLSSPADSASGFPAVRRRMTSLTLSFGSLRARGGRRLLESTRSFWSRSLGIDAHPR